MTVISEIQVVNEAVKIRFTDGSEITTSLERFIEAMSDDSARTLLNWLEGALQNA